MRSSRRGIIIATRRSRLATIQSEIVGDHLRRLHPRTTIRLDPLTSRGDQIQDRPLASFGGKGLFTKLIERALLEGRADVAVHSYKDMPTEETRGLVVAATPKRAAVHDVLVARDAASIDELREGATVGTCSPRRAAQLLHLRPDLRVVALRGSVETRIARVIEEKIIDATLLAAAGLDRLGLSNRVGHAVPVDQVLPAAGQGAMAVQVRGDDHTAMRRCVPLNDPMAGLLVNMEREVVHGLGADCHSPLAVLAEVSEAGDGIRLRARVLSLDGKTCLAEDRRARIERLHGLSEAVVKSLRDRGAKRVLREATLAAAEA